MVNEITTRHLSLVTPLKRLGIELLREGCDLLFIYSVCAGCEALFGIYVFKMHLRFGCDMLPRLLLSLRSDSIVSLALFPALR